MRRLAVIGAGRVGQTLARLWADAGAFEIGAVFSRRIGHAEAAVRFIGAGRALVDTSGLGPADVVMLSVPDDAIEPCAERLAREGCVMPGAVVFHCSGAKSSAALASVRAIGAHVASLHPVRSFAEPARAAATFGGTPCALEGDEPAYEVIQDAVELIGGLGFRVRAEQKLVYHAGTVLVSNYLVTLLEAAMHCFAAAGISREEGHAIALPLARGTLDNVAALDTVGALTGPIARGDAALVQDQLAALLERQPEVGALYAMHGRLAVPLSRNQGKAESTALDAIDAAFTRALAGIARRVPEEG